MSEEDFTEEEEDEDDEDDGEETPPWMIIFADLASLLLTFFVLIYSFSALDEGTTAKKIISFSRYLSFGSSAVGMQGEKGGGGKNPYFDPSKAKEDATGFVPEQDQANMLPTQTSVHFYNVFEKQIQLAEEEVAYGKIEKEISGEGISGAGGQLGTPSDFKKYFYEKKLEEVVSIEKGNSPSEYNLVFRFPELFQKEKVIFEEEGKEQLENVFLLLNKLPNDIEIEYFKDTKEDGDLALAKIEHLISYFNSKRNFINERIAVAFYDDLFSEKKDEKIKKKDTGAIAGIKAKMQKAENRIAGYIDKVGEKVGMGETKKQESVKQVVKKTGVVRIKVLSSFIGYQIYKEKLT